MSKLFGYWWGESSSGNQHLISPTPDEDDIIAVPQDRITQFHKLSGKEHPRRCVFTVEGWLEKKREYQQFREAKFGVDYV